MKIPYLREAATVGGIAAFILIVVPYVQGLLANMKGGSSSGGSW